MGHANFPKVLFFVAGSRVTDDHRKKAAKLGPGVLFRNSLHDTKDGAVETTDFVAGERDEIPERYRDFPPAIPYMQWLDDTDADHVKQHNEHLEKSLKIVDGARNVGWDTIEQSKGNRPDNSQENKRGQAHDVTQPWKQNA